MNFITIDFETANEKRYSVCSLGLVIVENGQIAESKYWLVKPPEMRFDSFNVSLHGITEKDVYDKPEFNILWHEIKGYFDNKIVFAHNANFDIYVLKDILDYYKIPHPNLRYCCTVKLSQRLWYLDNYKLKTVANHLNHEFKHHDALEDAKVCTEIVLKGCLETETTTIDDLLKKLKIRKSLFPEKDNNFYKIKSNYPTEHTYIKIKPAEKKNNISCLTIIFIAVPVIIIIFFVIMCSKF